jgi:hypothetical protein
MKFQYKVIQEMEKKKRTLTLVTEARETTFAC